MKGDIEGKSVGDRVSDRAFSLSHIESLIATPSALKAAREMQEIDNQPHEG